MMVEFIKILGTKKLKKIFRSFIPKVVRCMKIISKMENQKYILRKDNIGGIEPFSNIL